MCGCLDGFLTVSEWWIDVLNVSGGFWKVSGGYLEDACILSGGLVYLSLNSRLW